LCLSTDLFVSLFYLSICFFVPLLCLSINLFFFVSFCLSVCLCSFLLYIFQSVYLCIYFCTSASLCVFNPFVCLSLCLSISLSVFISFLCLSFCISIYLQTFSSSTDHDGKCMRPLSRQKRADNLTKSILFEKSSISTAAKILKVFDRNEKLFENSIFFSSFQIAFLSFYLFLK
jgi:hypothetical protein